MTLCKRGLTVTVEHCVGSVDGGGLRQDWLIDIQKTKGDWKKTKETQAEVSDTGDGADGALDFDGFVEGLLELAYVWTDDGLEDDPNA